MKGYAKAKNKINELGAEIIDVIEIKSNEFFYFIVKCDESKKDEIIDIGFKTFIG